jgi:hypothetical protein
MMNQQRLPLPTVPRGGPIGSTVQLSASGLIPGSGMIIAFANLQMYQLQKRVIIDETGSFSTTGIVPEWAKLDGVHWFFASFDDEIPVAMSAGFHVTAADGTARVRGTLGQRTGACVDLMDNGETLYHLQGDLGELKPGDHIAAIGTLADQNTACGGPGIAVAVSKAVATY